MDTNPLIQIEGQRPTPLSVITHDGHARRHYLARFHGRHDAVWCLCRGRPGIAMGVACRQQPTETYYLYPLHEGDGLKHSPQCPHYHEPGTEHSDPTDTRPVIELRGGRLNLNLAGPTYRGEESGKSSSVRRHGDASAASTGRLLTLLEALWIEAGLHEWRPGFDGKRHYGLIQYFLTQAAERIEIKGIPLARRFLAPPPYAPGRKERCNQALHAFMAAITRKSQGRTLHGYVVGQLRSFDTDQGWIRLTHLAPALSIPTGSLVSAARRFPFEPETSVVIACVEANGHACGTRHARPALQVLDIAAMEVADKRCWIPVDSEHERTLCRALVDAQRSFVKPLSASRLLEPSGDSEPLLPDFILQDAARKPLYMEVLGMMDDSDYAEHTAYKRHAYQQQGIATWWWDTRQPMPALPALAP